MAVCSGCARDNPNHFKFCMGCGTGLSSSGGGARVSPRGAAAGVPCSKCGSPNEPNHRFCASCGHNLVGSEAATRTTARLVALNPDGSEGATIPLQGTTTVGRSVGGVFAQDNFLSPRHASLTPQAGAVVVKDENSLNGIYRRISPDRRVALAPGQMFRLGQELVVFETLEADPANAEGVEAMGAPIEGYVGRIAMVLGRQTTGTAFPIPETGLNLGRERGDVLFAEDGYVSGMHCRLSYENGQVFLTDLGSSNGTYVRVYEAEPFKNGEVLLMGQQLFRVAC